jgi:outer membrane protein TolC
LSRTSRWFGIVATLGLAAAAQTARAQRPAIPPQLSLKQAVSIAFANSPLLRQSEARVGAMEAARAQVRSALLPQVSVGAFEAVRSVNLEAQGIQFPSIPGLGFALPTRVGPFSQFDARGFVNQEVLNFQHRYSDKAAGARLRASEAENLNTRELLALTVVVDYVTAQRNQASAATLRKQLALSRQLLTITADRASHGIASALDTKRAEQQTNNLQQALIESENALTIAKLELAKAMHAEIGADYELADIASFYDTTAPSQQEALATALESRPDYRAAQAQLRAAQLDLRSSRAERYPSVAFAADYGQSGRKPLQNLNTFRVQGSLNVPVFLGGRLSADVKQAQSRVDQAEAYLDEARAAIETDVLSAIANVSSARRQVEIAQSTIDLAQQEVDLSTARFTSGVTDNTEVVNAQDRLARAEDNRIRALFQLQMSQAGLQRAIGAAEKAYRP